jgi:hypothetical protein
VSPGNPARPSTAVQKLVLDTTVLFPLLVYCYIERGRAPQALLADARSAGPPLTVRDYDRWLKLFQSARLRLTTQHVIPELYWLVNRRLKALRPGDQVSFWHFCTDFLFEQAVEERPCALEDICSAPGFKGICARIGPVDAGLILLAKEEGCGFHESGSILVTDDKRTLHSEACSVGVRCELLPNLLQ